jgi:hypothetical protein
MILRRNDFAAATLYKKPKPLGANAAAHVSVHGRHVVRGCGFPFFSQPTQAARASGLLILDPLVFLSSIACAWERAYASFALLS